MLEVPVVGTDGDYGVIPITDMQAALATFGDGDLKVSSQGGRIDLTCGKTRVRLALLADEGFPDIAGTVPKSYAQIIELSTQALATAARAASVLDAPARVVLKARQNRIVLLVNSQELGSFQTMGGEGELSYEITLDSAYLANVRSFGDTIKMHLNDAESAVMIEGTIPGWRYWLAPLMPR
jgi:DNA polymerase III sliding clamp (beta) subunit (PCNA family)